MPAKKPYAIKGEVHFQNISDEKLSLYKDCIQDMMYNYCETSQQEIRSSLDKVYHDILSELLDRQDSDVEEPKSRVKTRKFKILKSPATRK